MVTEADEGFAYREEIEACQDAAKLTQLNDANRTEMETLIRNLSAAYDDNHDLATVTEIAIRLQYLGKIEAEIQAKLSRVADLGLPRSVGLKK